MKVKKQFSSFEEIAIGDIIQVRMTWTSYIAIIVDKDKCGFFTSEPDGGGEFWAKSSYKRQMNNINVIRINDIEDE